MRGGEDFCYAVPWKDKVTNGGNNTYSRYLDI